MNEAKRKLTSVAVSTPSGGSARCEVTCGEYPGYYKCGRVAKYVTDGSKPPGVMLVCGIHKRGRNVKPIAPNGKLSDSHP